MASGIKASSPTFLRAVDARVAGVLPVFAAVVLIVWPYLRYPGQIFYNRYFEAAMIFDPVFAYETYATGWSRNLHLGYPSLTEPSYLSVFTFAILILHAIGGTVFVSHAYPILLALFTFFSMFVYLRGRHAALPQTERTLVAFFFTINPLTAAMVHEGYSGMMIDYALIPLGLWLFDFALARRVPLAIGALPLVFTATSMFKLPQVAIAWVTIAFLRWDDWVALLRRYPRLAIALGASLAANAYWAIPMVLNLKLHAYLPIQGDTASEVAVSTQYSNLSNIVLSRVFGIFENNAHLCGSCGYYTSAAYTLGMSAIVILAILGCLQERKRSILILLAAGIVLATGYHYQDDIIGIPYQLLMQLPTFGIFRSSNVFLTLVFFAYSIGLVYVLLAAQTSPRRRRTIGLIALAAVALISWPMIDGSVLEKQSEQNGTVAAPNFYVTIPPAYYAARDFLRGLPTDGTTLLYPNQTFAAYRWGAYVQDFLPPFLARPTLARWYWKQNNPDVDALLETVTSPQAGTLRVAYLESAMRIDSVLVHADTLAPDTNRQGRFGSPIFHQGAVTIYRPAVPVVPFLSDDADPIVGIGGASQDVPILEALTGRTISDGVPRIGCGGSDSGFAFVRGATRAGSPVTIPAPAECNGRIVLSAYVNLGTGAPAVPKLAVFRRGRVVRSVRPDAAPAGLVERLSGTLDVRKGDIVGLLPSFRGEHILGFVAGRVLVRTAREVALGEALPLQLAGLVHAAPWATTLVLHESSDPSWVALTLHNGAVSLAPKFVADGYANGWTIAQGSTVLILNIAQLAFFGGLIIAIVAFAVVWRISIAPYVARGRSAGSGQ